MVAGKKLTKLARIGLSHSDRAKALAAKGLYSEALSELKIALFSLRNENRDGRLSDDIAGVLHSIGNVNLLLHKYNEAAEAFSDAVTIRRPMSNNPEIAGSLIGLSDAHRGLCDFDRAGSCLEDALQVALSLKNDRLATRVMEAMDALERTRDNQPRHAAGHGSSSHVYLPGAAGGVHAVVRNLELEVSPDAARIGFVVGFPGLEQDLPDREGDGGIIPGAGAFFGEEAGHIRSLSVVDEEEEQVAATVVPFKGLVFAPGSYHIDGPAPLPVCKRYTFTGGTGSLLGWKITANGWYRADCELDLPDPGRGFRAALALPYHVKLSRVSINVKKPLEYSVLRIDEGTFYATRDPHRVSRTHWPAYAFKRRLFEGSAFGALDIEAHSALKYAVIAFELVK